MNVGNNNNFDGNWFSLIPAEVCVNIYDYLCGRKCEVDVNGGVRKVVTTEDWVSIRNFGLVNRQFRSVCIAEGYAENIEQAMVIRVVELMEEGKGGKSLKEMGVLTACLLRERSRKSDGKNLMARLYEIAKSLLKKESIKVGFIERMLELMQNLVESNGVRVFSSEQQLSEVVFVVNEVGKFLVSNESDENLEFDLWRHADIYQC